MPLHVRSITQAGADYYMFTPRSSPLIGIATLPLYSSDRQLTLSAGLFALITLQLSLHSLRLEILIVNDYISLTLGSSSRHVLLVMVLLILGFIGWWTSAYLYHKRDIFTRNYLIYFRRPRIDVTGEKLWTQAIFSSIVDGAA